MDHSLRRVHRRKLKVVSEVLREYVTQQAQHAS